MSEFKLGKLPAVIDKRTITLSSILRLELLPPLPETYDIDTALDGIEDNFMYNNSKYGDCVIAARAHQTLRFEKFEQTTQIPITDQEVVYQYFLETGGPDRGLILLSSLKSWRNEGWTAAGKHYTIYAFASVDWKNHDQVKHCIHLLGGVNFGMRVYQTDIDQFNVGESWHLTGEDGGFKGGHGVYACKYADSISRSQMPPLLEGQKYRTMSPLEIEITGYDLKGIWCMTWGRKQFMTWDFWDARIDEAYGIVDNKNHWMEHDSPVDVELLDSYLDEITADNPQPPGCLFAFLNLFKRLRR